MTNKENEEIIFGGGCFWCTEAVFKLIKGVVSVTSGYAGGGAEKPTYKQVHTGKTGFIEVVRIEFQPDQTSIKQLLDVFFSSHDPTSLNKQGDDIGEQYKSVIFYTNPKQKDLATEYIKQVNQNGKFTKPIVTEIKPLENFHEAEEDHKDYYANNPDQAYCQIVIDPKLEKVRHEFSNLLK